MKHYLNLKDGVVFAHHQSEGEIESGENIIEVDGNEDSYLNKKYENNQFIPASIIKYAILDSKNNAIVDIKQTYFISEVENNPIITDEDVTFLWTWDGIKFNPPVRIKEVESIIAPTPIDPSQETIKEINS